MLEHEIFFPGDVTLHSLFIDPDFVDKLPESCTVLSVNNLLHELICHVSQMRDPISESDKRFMLVLIDAISTSKRSEIYLPSAKDARVAKVMDSLAKVLICKPDFNELAISVNISSRTLARLFIKETGLTIGAWNKRLLAQVAVLKLNEGRNVTQVALELGYSSVSAFVEMFNQQIGENPGKFVKKLAEASSRFSNK